MTTTRELIDHHPFLSDIDVAARDRLAHAAQRVDFPAGSAVFAEGGPADRFWLIHDGHVQLDLHLAGPGSVIIETLSAGEVLGWSWLFPPHRWQFGATAVEPTVAVEFDGAAVLGLLDADPALGYELMRRFTCVVVHRLQATRVRLLDLYQRP